MRIDVLTLFPEILEPVLKESLLGKAIEQEHLDIALTNPRDFTQDRHRTVDDTPYGGGAGMVMKCEPLFAAIESLKDRNSLKRVIHLSPRGRRLDQDLVKELAREKDLVLLCSRYEGVDERVVEGIVTDEVSIGDYVLSGGEVPALVLIEAISRMLPGVIGDWESVETDSFFNGLLGIAQYTRPQTFREMSVPDVLMSGHHEVIRRWRRKEALRVTLQRRPDLIDKLVLTKEDNELLAELEAERSRTEKEIQP